MAKIDWKNVWEKALKDPEIFPVKVTNKNTVSVSCPTRFSDTGKFSIEITPSFNDKSIDFEMLIFNDNISLEDINFKDVDKSDFNSLAKQLVEFELSNRILDRFTIESDGFSNSTEAKNSLVDYINNKATESGRMFDDKLDELNDSLDNKKSELNSFTNNRKIILKKLESILHTHYEWNTIKNESFGDSVVPFYDQHGNLVAVVSIVDNFIVVDLAKDITAKVSMLKSDEEIEDELTTDIDNANTLLADREIDQLKDIIAGTPVPPMEMEDSLEEDDYYESLSNRISKLENMYINYKLRKLD